MLSRRDFVRLSGGVTAALGALGALGASLAPTVAHTINNQIVNIEGNPDSPVSEGNLCPKGAASYQLAVNERRWTTVKYRAPNSDQWEDRPLDWAMDRRSEEHTS